MDVTVTDLRAHLKDYLASVRAGEQVIVTDHGVPVARLVPVEAADLLERLAVQGLIARPAVAPRPVAGGRRRPRAARPVAGLVSELRR